MNDQPTGRSQFDGFRATIASLEKWEVELRIALHHGGDAHSFDDLAEMVLTGKVHFYDFGDCFIVMEIVNYPRFNVYHGFLAGGDMESILAQETLIERVGKSFGCKYLSIAGRKGWERVFQKRGWSFICVTMYHEIPDHERTTQ